MSYTWNGAPPPPPRPIGPAGWLRVLRRGAPILGLLAVAFPLLLILRVPERLIAGQARPVTPWITQGVCIAACFLIGLPREMRGTPLRGPGAFVANHVSWLDIFVLNASGRITFVAKSEVAGWAGIGWLARGTGTVFIARERRAAAGQAALLRARLEAGERLMIFPEGTSSDGLRVLPFRATLFAPFLNADLDPGFRVQPITLAYEAPEGEAAAFYGWWGDMAFGRSLLQVLAVRRQGRVRVTCHDPISVTEVSDRKTLAKAAEDAVRARL